MNIQLLAAAVAIMGASIVMAQEAVQLEVPASHLTRAEVQANLAETDLSLPQEVRDTVQPVAGERSRADVKAELSDSAAHGGWGVNEAGQVSLPSVDAESR